MDGVTCLDNHMMQCRGFPSGLILELITAFPIVPLMESALQVSTKADHILHEKSKETDKSTDMTLQIKWIWIVMIMLTINSWDQSHERSKVTQCNLAWPCFAETQACTVCSGLLQLY